MSDDKNKKSDSRKINLDIKKEKGSIRDATKEKMSVPDFELTPDPPKKNNKSSNS